MTKTRVFIVAPPRGNGEGAVHLEDVRKNAQRLAEARGWTVTTYRLRQIKSDKPGGMLLMDSIDATSLYRALHRNDCAVVQVGAGARVPLHPKQTALSRNAVPLEKFVRYKAVFERVNGRETPDSAIRRIAEHIAVCECDSERDPRCLPMHVFDPEHDHETCPLSDAVKVRAHYGGPKIRTDANRREWAPPQGHAHGNDELLVRGYQLQRGYHWDVKAGRNFSELITTSEIWRMPSASYLNVSPDANVRGGQSSAVSAKKVFALTTKAPNREKTFGRAPVPRAKQPSSR